MVDGIEIKNLNNHLYTGKEHYSLGSPNHRGLSLYATYGVRHSGRRKNLASKLWGILALGGVAYYFNDSGEWLDCEGANPQQGVKIEAGDLLIFDPFARYAIFPDCHYKPWLSEQIGNLFHGLAWEAPVSEYNPEALDKITSPLIESLPSELNREACLKNL